MIQIASVLAVATVLMDSNIWAEKRGLCARQNYLCRNLSQNCRGSLYARGCIYNCGIVQHNLYRMGGDLFYTIFLLAMGGLGTIHCV